MSPNVPATRELLELAAMEAALVPPAECIRPVHHPPPHQRPAAGRQRRASTKPGPPPGSNPRSAPADGLRGHPPERPEGSRERPIHPDRRGRRPPGPGKQRGDGRELPAPGRRTERARLKHLPPGDDVGAADAGKLAEAADPEHQHVSNGFKSIATR